MEPNSEQLATRFDSVPVPDGNQFAGTGVGQPGHDAWLKAQLEGEAEPKTDPEVNPDSKSEPAQGAPEAYEFKAPEGQSFDPKVLESFSEAMREANQTQESAQKILDKVAPALAERAEEHVKAVHQQWIEASTADKEFGGEKLRENLGIARKAFEQLTPADREFLETTGLGNHPTIIRILYRHGKVLSEDGYVGGAGRAQETRQPWEVLYENSL